MRLLSALAGLALVGTSHAARPINYENCGTFVYSDGTEEEIVCDSPSAPVLPRPAPGTAPAPTVPGGGRPVYGPPTARCQRCRTELDKARESAVREYDICAKIAREWAESMVRQGYYRDSLIRQEPLLPLVRREECMAYNHIAAEIGWARGCVVMHYWDEPNPRYIEEVNKYLRPSPGESVTSGSGSATVGAQGAFTLSYTVGGQTRTHTIAQTEGSAERCRAAHLKAEGDAVQNYANCRGGEICD